MVASSRRNVFVVARSRSTSAGDAEVSRPPEAKSAPFKKSRRVMVLAILHRLSARESLLLKGGKHSLFAGTVAIFFRAVQYPESGVYARDLTINPALPVSSAQLPGT